jgi:DNA replication and repair protein RecF
MSISHIRIRDFRNIRACELEPAAGVNLIVGGNGAGKTALLEAVYLIARGKSFRSSGARALVREGAAFLEVFAAIAAREGARHRVGVRAAKGARRIRVDGREETRASALARLVPVGLLVPQSHAVMDGGPEARRRLLDWGVFHVEQGYRDEVLRFRRTLRQRNLALKQGRRGAAAWEGALAESGERVHASRERYCAELNRILGRWGSRLLGRTLQVVLRSGWSEGAGALQDALGRRRERDLETGYTGAGPHRADLAIVMDGREVAQYASRGQQKMIIAALVLAQAQLLEQRRPGDLVLLVDDFPAELDRDWRGALWRGIEVLGCQAILTATELELFPRTASAVFHVEQGRVTCA